MPFDGGADILSEDMNLFSASLKVQNLIFFDFWMRALSCVLTREFRIRICSGPNQRGVQSRDDKIEGILTPKKTQFTPKLPRALPS